MIVSESALQLDNDFEGAVLIFECTKFVNILDPMLVL